MNFSIAFEYYKKSAQLGNEKAQRSLGYFYDTGKGTKIDKSLVILLFFKHNFLQPKTNQKTKKKKKKTNFTFNSHFYIIHLLQKISI